MIFFSGWSSWSRSVLNLKNHRIFALFLGGGKQWYLGLVNLYVCTSKSHHVTNQSEQHIIWTKQTYRSEMLSKHVWSRSTLFVQFSIWKSYCNLFFIKMCFATSVHQPKRRVDLQRAVCKWGYKYPKMIHIILYMYILIHIVHCIHALYTKTICEQMQHICCRH